MKRIHRIVGFSGILPYFLTTLILVGGAMKTDIMTIPEVAEYLKLTEKTAYRLAAEGKLPGFKVGGAWRFRKADIDGWIDLQRAETKGGKGR